MNLPPHPGFRDVLWDFVRSGPLQDAIRIRVFASEEELFEREDETDGYEWTVPRGLVPRTERRITPLDPQTAFAAGQRLWASLPDPVRTAVLQSASLPTRVKISTDVKDVLFLPWECLPLPTGAFVARSVPVRYPVPPLSTGLPVKILFVVTNPKDERLLRMSEELDAVRIDTTGDYASDVAWEATVPGVRARLERFQPHIVHYVGHGASSAGQGYLVLHDEDQHTFWVSARALAALLPSSVRLMCLSTCFTAENYDIRGLSLFAQAPSDVMIPTTVVNRLPLDMQSQPTIKQFWTTFYTELKSARGDTASAFSAARAAISGSRDWPSFSLVLRDGTGWSLAIDTHAADTPEATSAAFDALYWTTMANYLTQQTGASPRGVRDVLRNKSREEAQRADDAFGSTGGFRWPEKERR